MYNILPWQDLENEQFYPHSQDSDDEDDDDDEEEDHEEKAGKAKPYIMDPDHRLLLRVTKPLLQSRNAAVSLSFYLNVVVVIGSKLLVLLISLIEVVVQAILEMVCAPRLAHTTAYRWTLFNEN